MIITIEEVKTYKIDTDEERKDLIENYPNKLFREECLTELKDLEEWCLDPQKLPEVLSPFDLSQYETGNIKMRTVDIEHKIY